MNSRGQSAVEYLIITSFLLVITGIIFAYSLFIYTDSVSSSTANNAVNSIVNTVDQVYALGPGSTLFVEINIPQNISNLELKNLPEPCIPPPTSLLPGQTRCIKTAMILKLSTSGGVSDVAKSAKGLFEFSGPTETALKKQGHYFVKVSWDSSLNSSQNIITVCLHDGDGTCQTGQ